jgi:opacity protein-like surface antigen
MKKLYILLFISMTIFSTTNGQFTKIGGGLGFTTGFPFHQQTWDYNKSGKFDVSFKGIYELNLPIHISPSFAYFLPHISKQADMKTIVSSMMFDLNGHYVFNSLDRFEFYGLAGLDILLAWKKETFTGSPASKERDNALGLNLGAGTYMKITEQLDLYVEAKYVFSKYHQFMLNAGVLLNLQWLSKNENPDI